jgi:hypothetical protein
MDNGVPKTPFDVAVSFKWAGVEEYDRSSIDAFPAYLSKDVKTFIDAVTKLVCPNLSGLVISVSPT